MGQGESRASGRASTSPLVRLVVLSAIGLLLCTGMLLAVLQAGPGWRWVPAGWRSPASVDATVWTALATGLLAYLVSAWVWALKRTDAAALFAVSGMATLVFCFSSVVDSLALSLPPAAVSALWTTNALGASAFGIIMTCLFLVYPARLPHWKALVALAVVGFGGWTLLRTFGPLRDLREVQQITTVETLGIMLVVACQLRASAGDPRKLAIARWLGASVLIGAGGFIGTVALPLTFGSMPLVPSQQAFAFFLIIYAGLAVGLMRYRLFDLGAWAYRLLFYAFALLLLVVLDMFLITVLAIGRPEATGISLLLVAFAYLPLREWLWRRFAAGEPASGEALFQQVIEAALQREPGERAQAWQALLRARFRPLELASMAAPVAAPAIEEEGLVLLVPGTLDSPATRLKYGNRGRSLFVAADVGVVAQLVRVAAHAQESRKAYDRGAAEERVRIARDLHDNIGAQLMRALHSDAPARKDAMIRDTLVDLRDVVNQAHGSGSSLDEALVALRAETADRLAAHGMLLEWSVDVDGAVPIAPACAHVLRSFVREAASNTIKHAQASRFRFAATLSGGTVHIRIGDDGIGFDAGTVGRGRGLDNMAVRLEGVGGSFALQPSAGGTALAASLPLQPARS